MPSSSPTTPAKVSASVSSPLASPAVAAARAAGAVVIFVVGAPGSGRRSLCSALEDKQRCVHVDVQAALRAEVVSGSPRGAKVSTMISLRKVIPTRLIIDIIAEVISSAEAPVVISSFPRTADDAMLFEELIGTPVGALLLEADDATLAARLLARGRGRTRAAAASVARCRVKVSRVPARPVRVALHATEPAGRDASDVVQRRLAVFRGRVGGVVEALERMCTVTRLDGKAAQPQVLAAGTAAFDAVVRKVAPAPAAES